jgi:hypothetical protein
LGFVDVTALIEAGLGPAGPDDSICPACGGYLHMYAAVCFGCGHERGSLFEANLAKLRTLMAMPLERLLKTFGFEGIRFEGTAEHQVTMARVLAYNLLWLGLADQPRWAIPTTHVSYLGGLEAAPHSEYAQFVWEHDRIDIVSDRTRRRICSIDPAQMLSVTAHATLDEVLGGATFGFVSGPAIFLRSMPPTQGGALKLVFADDDGIWRVAVIGNRTGLTDKRYTFEAYRAWAASLAELCRWHTVGRQFELLNFAYAVALGIDVGTAGDSEAAAAHSETKVCPECAETVKAAARICRFCSHRFGAPEAETSNRPRAAGAQPSGKRAAEAALEKGPFWLALINKVEDITADDAADMIQRAERAPTPDRRNAIWFEWGRRVNPLFTNYRREVQSKRHIADPVPGLTEGALRALELFEAATAKLAANDISGQEQVYSAADAWIALRRLYGG